MATILSPSLLQSVSPPQANAYRAEILRGLLIVRGALLGVTVLAIASALYWRGSPNRIEPASKSQPRDFLTLAAIILLAALLRIPNLNASLWWDELGTFTRIVNRSFAVVFSFSANANNHILNSALMKVVASLGGTTEWMLRLPAFSAGVLLPATAFWLLRPVGYRFAAICGVLTAVHPSLIIHSCEARGYAGAVLFVLISSLLNARLLRQATVSGSVAYILTGVLAMGLWRVWPWAAWGTRGARSVFRTSTVS